MKTSILIPAIALTGLLFAANAAAEMPDVMAKATFAVHCYDVGANALIDKPGVISVERGWSGGREVDRVIFNPKTVTLGQLETWLKQADTYVGTLETEITTKPEKAMVQ
jgi:hypothetical protein